MGTGWIYPSRSAGVLGVTALLATLALSWEVVPPDILRLSFANTGGDIGLAERSVFSPSEEKLKGGSSERKAVV
jgi:hypothetical protein